MKMKMIITVIAICLAVGMILPLAVFAVEADGDLPFHDVPRTSWFYDAVKSVYDAGAMKGVANDSFGPNDPMTRAQFVTILARISGEGYGGLADEATFKDTAKNDYYSDALGWAVKNGLINGYPDNSFQPDSPILRQEFAAVFARYLSYKKLEITGDDVASGFRDSSSFPDYAKESIETLRKTGLVKGDSAGNYNPEDNMTRAEIAQVIARFLEKTAEKKTLEEKVTVFLDKYLCSAHGKLDLFFNYTDSSLTEENTAALLRGLIGLDGEVTVKFDDFSALVDGYSGGGDGAGDPGAGWSWIDGVKVTFTDPKTQETYTAEIDFSLRKVIPTGELNEYKNGALGVCPEDANTNMKNAYPKFNEAATEDGEIYAGYSGRHNAKDIETFFRKLTGLTDKNAYEFILAGFDPKKPGQPFYPMFRDRKNADGRLDVIWIETALEGTVEQVPLEFLVEDFIDEYTCFAHGKIDLFFNYAETSLTEENMAALLRDLIGLDDDVTVKFANFRELLNSYKDSGDGAGAPGNGWTWYEDIKVTFSDPSTKETYTAYFDFSLRKVLPLGEIEEYKNGVAGPCPEASNEDMRNAYDALNKVATTDGEIYRGYTGGYNTAEIEAFFRELTGLTDKDAFEFTAVGFDPAIPGKPFYPMFRDLNNEYGKIDVIWVETAFEP